MLCVKTEKKILTLQCLTMIILSVPPPHVRYPLLLLLLMPSFSFSEIQQWQIRMLSSKWQSVKTSIKLLIEETVGWGEEACDVVCVGMTELVLQRWEVTETCQRSQSARGQPHYAVNPWMLLLCGCVHWCKPHKKTVKMDLFFCLHPLIYTTPFTNSTSHGH